MIGSHHEEKWQQRDQRNRALARTLPLVVLLAVWTAAGLAQTLTPTDAVGHKTASPQALPNLQLIQELTRPHTTTSLTWSSDGSKLAAYTVAPEAQSIAGKLLTVWSADGQIVREIEPPDFFFYSDDPLTFVAGGKQIATPPWGKSPQLGFMVFDIESGKVVREIEGPEHDRGRPDNAAVALASSPDQSMLAVVFGAGRSHPVALYSTQDWSKVATLTESGPTHPEKLAFSPDGRLLAVVEFADVYIYDIVSKRLVQTIGPFEIGMIHTLPASPNDLVSPYDMALSPDDTLIAVAAGNPTGSRVVDPLRIFRVDSGARIASFPTPLRTIHCVAWSPDGHFLAFISERGDQVLHLWDPSRPETERIAKLTGHAASLAFSPDGTKLAVAHGSKVAIYRLTP